MATLADSLDAFLSDVEHRRHLRTNTIRAYRYDLAAAAIQLTAPLDQLTLEMIEAWLQAQAIAPSTKVRRMASLQRFFIWAVRYCPTNPLANREPLRIERRLPRPIRSARDRDTLDAMIATAPQPYRLIFTILWETGMRVSEVLGLNIDDVTLERGCGGLLVRNAKIKLSVWSSSVKKQRPKVSVDSVAIYGSVRGNPAMHRCFGHVAGGVCPTTSSITIGSNCVALLACSMLRGSHVIRSTNCAIREERNSLNLGIHWKLPNAP